MNSKPGRLTGGGIRSLPQDRIGDMLDRIKIEGSGKKRRVKSVRYRITGFRNPQNGEWISRNPRNGQYYVVRNGRHRGIKPTPDMIRSTDMVSLEVEIDRGKGPRIYYVSTPGV